MKDFRLYIFVTSFLINNRIYSSGKRFAMIQMKCCLLRLLQHVRISPAPLAAPRSEPFFADPRSPLTLHPADSLVTLTLL